MRGQHLFWPLVILGLLAVIGLGQRAQDRWLGSRQLNTVEAITLQASQTGRVDGRLLQRNLEILRKTSDLLPTDVSVPVARGGQYLLLNRPKAAIRAYEEALGMERRGEIYANLGRALLADGDRRGARQAFRRAVALDANLAGPLRPIMQQLAQESGS